MFSATASTRKFAAFLFDLEGTLVGYNKEFEGQWTGKLLREFGEKSGDSYLRNISDNDVYYFLSHPFARRNELLLAWGYPSIEAYMQQWTTPEALKAKANHLHCYEDVHILNSIHSRKYLLGLVTSSPVETLEHALHLLESELGYNPFSAVVCASADSGIKMKPDPQGLEVCLTELRTDSKQSNYTGNEDVDVLAAQSARMWSFLVKRHEHPTQTRPSVIIKSLRFLQAWL